MFKLEVIPVLEILFPLSSLHSELQTEWTSAELPVQKLLSYPLPVWRHFVPVARPGLEAGAQGVWGTQVPQRGPGAEPIWWVVRGA